VAVQFLTLPNFSAFAQPRKADLTKSVQMNTKRR